MEQWLIFVVGDRGVGKTSFRFKACLGYTEEEIDETMPEDIARRFMLFDDVSAVVELEESRNWIPEYTFFSPAGTGIYPLAHYTGYTHYFDYFILMYDITSADSFTSIEFHHRLVTEIRAAKNLRTGRAEQKEPAFFLIGSKSDLEDRREVSTAEGQELAARLEGCLGFMETSCNGDPSQAVHLYIWALRLACPQVVRSPPQIKTRPWFKRLSLPAFGNK